MKRFLVQILRGFKNPILIFFCLNALCYLTLFRVLIVAFPFRFWGYRCGIPYAETLRTPIRPARLPFIISAVYFVSRYVPWTSLCLDRALSAAFMLKRYGVSSTLYIGIAKENESWKAHAWLRVGDKMVMGYSDTQPFSAVKTIACIA